MAVTKKILPPCRIYREIQQDEQLVIFGDPAESRDYCAAVAVSKKHADMPIIFNEQIESSQFGYELHKIAKYIHTKTDIWPKIAVERNMGQATIHVLSTLNYSNLYRMSIFDSSMHKESEKIGWLTTEATRRKMLDDFGLALRQKSVKIYDKDLFDQLQAFIVKNGKPQAEYGKHDDLVIAAAGAWQLYLTVPLEFGDDQGSGDLRSDRSKWRFT